MSICKNYLYYHIQIFFKIFNLSININFYMARKIEDIELDIAEIKQLVLTAKRPNNQAALPKHLSTLRS